MFRRRRAESADEQPADGAAEWPEDDAGADEAAPAAGQAGDSPAGRGGEGGPWDVADAFPARDRIELGCLRVPAVPGVDVQLNFSGDQALAVVLVRGESMLQLQAFAAPKRAGLWDDIRAEIIAELKAAGGHGEEAAGPFGVEVRARVPAEPAAAGRAARGMQPARFLGVDGPRWFLRGVISGPAAAHASQAKVLEEVFGGIVVVRGDHPAPPRDLLELRLPADAQEALDAQIAQAQEREPLNPFARGPEITETR